LHAVFEQVFGRALFKAAFFKDFEAKLQIQIHQQTPITAGNRAGSNIS
jgi:hypothetical protein|tara:strand:+ start:193 stop:336 length:144 start_codon:yes stop_codon:yes gene_type:complete